MSYYIGVVDSIRIVVFYPITFWRYFGVMVKLYSLDIVKLRPIVRSPSPKERGSERLAFFHHLFEELFV